VILLGSTVSTAQQYWLTTAKTADGCMLVDRGSGLQYSTICAAESINYHPVSELKQPIVMDLTASYAQSQILSVIQPTTANSEGLVWKLMADHDDLLLSTDHRIADLTAGKFINAMQSRTMVPTIQSYHQYRADFDATSLIIGGEPVRTDLPVTTFGGSLAEVIALDRVLAPVAKQALESYLAIKYSVPLAPKVNYTNTTGHILWDHSSNEEYAHRVAGIGRDDRLSLQQKQSRAPLGDGHIAIGLGNIHPYNEDNNSPLQDGSYLLWSDDDGAIDLSSTNGGLPTLSRSWKLTRTGADISTPLVFELSHEGLQDDLPQDYSYWLQCSSDQDFSVEQTDYTILSKHDKVLHTEPFTLAAHHTYFTLTKAPQLAAALTVSAGSCSEQTDGQITAKILGGSPPYQLYITDTEGYAEDQPLTGNDLALITDLPSGEYQLTVTDSEGLSYSSSFYVNSLPELALPNQLVLQDESQYVSAVADMGYEYTWTDPNGMTTSGPTVLIDEAGTYTLEYRKGDCLAWHTIHVSDSRNTIEETNLSPNPSYTGHFTYRATLRQSMPYSISITTIDGQLIAHENYPAARYINHSSRLWRSGTYLVTLQAGRSIKTDKLIVRR